MSELDTLLRTASPLESLRALLAGSVDYAGLFPPAKLPVEEAVTEYASVHCSPCSWMLGRFVAPSARLSELRRTVAEAQLSHETWHIALTGEDPCQMAEAAAEVNAQQQVAGGPRIVVEAFEMRARDSAEIRELAAKIPAQFEGYFEIPLGDQVAACAEAALTTGRFLKARTGGSTAGSIPPATAIAGFIHACVRSKVRFKLTAGLHHPLRAFHPLDHHPGSPPVLMHGFLNVFFAAAFAQKGMEPPRLIEILEEQSPEAFRFNAAGVSWRKKTILNEELTIARRGTIVSFGSCSFREPVDGLRKLGWL